jgi:hypothetical protein
VKVEVAAQEVGDEPQVPLTVGQAGRSGLCLLDAGGEIGDVLAQRAHAFAGRRVADEVGDQEPQQRLALERQDLPLIEQFVTAIGGDFDDATVRPGRREFVG